MNMRKISAIIISCFVLLTGCSSFQNSTNEKINRSPFSLGEELAVCIEEKQTLENVRATMNIDEDVLHPVYGEEVYQWQLSDIVYGDVNYKVLLDVTYISSDEVEPTLFYVSFVHKFSGADAWISALHAVEGLVEEANQRYGDSLRITQGGSFSFDVLAKNDSDMESAALYPGGDLMEHWNVSSSDTGGRDIRVRTEIYSLSQCEEDTYVVTLTYYYTNELLPQLGPARAFFESIRIDLE